MEKQIRNSNHELLRMIAMYMIIFIHANMYLNYFCSGSVRTICNGLVNGICNIGVSCFILISGYYGVKPDLRKIVKMECMMITYSFLETVILCIAFPEQIRGGILLEQVVKSCIPFISRKYWFYSCYLCLIFFSGYIQKFIEHLSKSEFQKFLGLCIFLFSVLPTLFYFELVPDNGKGLVQMIMVYMIGRYIRMYKDILLPRKNAVLLFVVLWAANGVSHEFPVRLGGIYFHICKDNSVTNLIMAVILFYLFKDIKWQSALMNKMAGFIFAVFALNNTLVTVVMEKFIVGWKAEISAIAGFGALAGVVFLILAVCLLIGAVREWLLGKTDIKLANIFQNSGVYIYRKICNIFHRFV